MVFLTEIDIVSRKDKKEVLVFHNAQVFFHDVVEIMSKKYSTITQEKIKLFMEKFFKHISGDLNISFASMGDKHIVAIPEGRIIYHTLTKKIRVYIKEGGE